MSKKSLSPRQRLIIKLHRDRYQLKEIGEMFAVTKGRIHEILKDIEKRAIQYSLGGVNNYPPHGEMIRTQL